MSGRHEVTLRHVVAAVLVAALFACADVPIQNEHVAPTDLPPAVRNAVQQKFPRAEIVFAQRERRLDRVHYEILIKDSDGRYELEVSEQGVIRKMDRKGY
jgi:hypothetical protein